MANQDQALDTRRVEELVAISYAPSWNHPRVAANTSSSTSIVIGVMGLTGSGKSTLISMLTGQDAPIGHTLEACMNIHLREKSSK
jgi:ABC-type lipoprotein export system ATPase subunit